MVSPRVVRGGRGRSAGRGQGRVRGDVRPEYPAPEYARSPRFVCFVCRQRAREGVYASVYDERVPSAGWTARCSVRGDAEALEVDDDPDEGVRGMKKNWMARRMGHFGNRSVGRASGPVNRLHRRLTHGSDAGYAPGRGGLRRERADGEPEGPGDPDRRRCGGRRRARLRRRFGPDPMEVLGRWEAFAEWAGAFDRGDATSRFSEADLGPPVPRPAQGLRHRRRTTRARRGSRPRAAEDARWSSPSSRPACRPARRRRPLVAPSSTGRWSWWSSWRAADGASRGRARSSTSPATRSGQDISDRRLQFSEQPPQFSLGKSITTFGPIGPRRRHARRRSPNPNDLGLTLRRRRRADAGRPDERPDLRRPALVAYLSQHVHARAGRPHLHRDAGGRRLDARSAARTSSPGRSSRARSKG